ncbi:MAG: phosphoribosyltransferase, partial [Candidatus Obscuribacterales bacterium]|nr:phosphoribosyltransferase [Candidatus Obscuribacterales bacterium]
MQVVQPERHGTYVVTYDVASRLQAFRLKNVTVPRPNDSLFERFHMSLFGKIQQALPGIAIDTIEMSELRRKIWEQVDSRITDLSQQAVLSTCPEIADSNPKSEGLLLNINRLFNTDGQLIGHGPRPGFESLAKQYDDLAKKIAGRSVVLIEDGAFSGGTLRSVLHELNSRGVTVTAIVIGFCCTR